MEFNFVKGQRLILELHSEEVLEGDYVSGNKNRIELSNIIDVDNPNASKISEIQCFYKNDIRHVRIINNESSLNNSNDDSNLTDQYNSQVMFLSKDEYENLKDMMCNYIYMATTDQRYHAAVQDLIKCENIGVVGLGSQYGRSSQLQLLLLCTWNQVYIFDIFSFNRKDFEPELKNILESTDIKKIVHDSRPIVDCLYHCHKVNMENIFDTQIADLIVQKNKGNVPTELRKLSECLAHYFNLPVNLLEQAEETEVKIWQKRPLTDGKKRRAAVLALHLIILKNKLEEMMLKDFYEAVKIHSNSVKQESSYESLMMTFKSKEIPAEILSTLSIQ